MTKVQPGFHLNQTKFGTWRLEVWGGTSPEVISAIKNLEYSWLVLSSGSTWEDLSFLVDQRKKIEKLTIETEKCDWKSISSLDNCRVMQIGGWFKAPLCFSNFTLLEELETYWNKGYDDSIYDLHNLKKLKIVGWKEESCDRLKSLVALRELHLVSAACRSLSGLENLRNIRRLTLYDMKQLSNCDHVSGLGLQALEIEKIKGITSFDFLDDLHHLELLELIDCGKIPTLQFLRGSNKLRHIALGKTVVVDGALKWLCGHPTLQVCRFVDMRHYDCSREEMRSCLRSSE